MSVNRVKEQRKGLFYYVIVIGYVGLMTIAFYVSTEKRGIIPALPTTLRYVCDAGIIVLALLYFLVTYMKNRIRVAMTLAWIWSFPYIGMTMISLLIWIVERMDLNYIGRGLINVGCAELNVIAVVCAIWLFGEHAVDYSFYGAMGGVVLVALRAILDYGPAEFIRQYLALVLSFAGDTGKAMRYMEFHDLSQGLGIFLMYYIWTFRKTKRNILLLFLSFICFTLTLKRIDVMAIAAGVVFGRYFHHLPFRRRWYFIVVFEIALIAFVYIYLWLIKEGYYKVIMNRLGIDPMSRDIIYDYYKDFFELSPTYLGRGLRYIYVHITEADRVIHVTRKITMRVVAAHNEYMTYFIELGFWGFIFWLWSNSWYRMNALRRAFGWEAVTFSLMVIFYAFVSYATDNTYFYFSINYVGFVTSGVSVLSSRKAKEYG